MDLLNFSAHFLFLSDLYYIVIFFFSKLKVEIFKEWVGWEEEKRGMNSTIGHWKKNRDGEKWVRER